MMATPAGGGAGESLQDRIKAEQLISAVMRAFYTDNTVVVMDALIRDSCIPEEEIAPRLKLPGKEVRKILDMLLEKDHLIAKESVILPSISSSSSSNNTNNAGTICYYYVDYQHCVDVIRYRIHLMNKMLRTQENESYNSEKQQCPTCFREYSTLQALAMQCADGYFACSFCCPYDNFLSIPSEPYFRLKAIDTSTKIAHVSGLKSKIEQQFNVDTAGHIGIYQLLTDLKDKKLSSNLPSDNIKKGHIKHDISGLDERTKQNINYNYANSAKFKGSGSRIKKKSLNKMNAGGDLFRGNNDSDAEVEEYEIEIYEDDEDAQAANRNVEGTRVVDHLSAIPSLRTSAAEDATLPVFLRKSHVPGAQETLDKVKDIQDQRSGSKAEGYDEDDTENPPMKRVKIEEEELEVDPDNIEWEAAEEEDDEVIEMDDNMEWEAEE